MPDCKKKKTLSTFLSCLQNKNQLSDIQEDEKLARQQEEMYAMLCDVAQV